MGNSWVLRADLSFQSGALRQRRAEEGHFLHIKHAALPTARICVNKSILIDGEKREERKREGEKHSQTVEEIKGSTLGSRRCYKT